MRVAEGLDDAVDGAGTQGARIDRVGLNEVRLQDAVDLIEDSEVATVCRDRGRGLRAVLADGVPHDARQGDGEGHGQGQHSPLSRLPHHFTSVLIDITTLTPEARRTSERLPPAALRPRRCLMGTISV